MCRLTGVLRETMIAGLFVVLAVAATWPLGRLLPVAVADPGDPLINTWILSWGVWSLEHAPLSVYQAPIFHPAGDALTYSENLFGLLPMAAVLSLFAEPLAVHNILLILGFAASGYGGFVLGRVATGSGAAGLVTGIAWGFCNWRYVHLTHLQHVWGALLPLLLAAIVHYDRRRSWRSGAVVALVFLLNGLMNLHHLIFGSAGLVVALGVLLFTSRERRTAPYLWRLGAPLFLAAGVLVALLWPYWRAARAGDARGDLGETVGYSATLRDWLPGSGTQEPERSVFPGWTITIAGLAGLFVLMRERPAGLRRDLLLVASGWIALGVLLSLGPRTGAYRFAFEHLPVLAGIRAAARWAVLALTGLSLLAGVAVAAAGRARAVFALVLSLGLFAETFRAPIRWYLMPAETPAVYRWLRDADVRGAVLELPIGVNRRDYYSMLGAAVHRKPIFNGASGWSPPFHRKLTAAFSAPVIADSLLDELEATGCALIIVHSDALGSNAAEIRRWLGDAVERRRLAFVGRFEAGITGDYVFAVGREAQGDSAVLARFLGNREPPPNRLPFGYLISPSPGREIRGPLDVRGWALAESGIESVRLWFGNKGCFVEAASEPATYLATSFPGYPTGDAGFRARLPGRPCGRPESDVLVEIVDQRGRRTALPHVWFEWR